MRSPSAERVGEGKVADTVRPPKKQKRKQEHQKLHMSSSACAPPAVITIDSDREKEPQRTECNSNITWTGTAQINEMENESPSSFPWMTGCKSVYRSSKEACCRGPAKNYSISTRRRDLDSDIKNADIEFQETATDQSLFPEVTSSNTPHIGPVTSLGQGAEA